MLFRLRYRKHGMVDTGVIEATDFATAERVGQRYCELGDGPSFVYVRVEPWLLADESILTAPGRDETPAALPQDEARPAAKPTITEQKDRLRTRQGVVPATDADGEASAAVVGADRKAARVGA